MKADKKTVNRLLNTAKGQINGIQKMIDEDKYCIEISNQILASIAILKKANEEVIKAHLQHCVKESFDSGIDTNEKIEEVMQIIAKISK